MKKRVKKRKPVLNPDEMRGRVVTKGGVMYVSSTSYQEFARCSMKFYYNKIRRMRLRPEYAGASAALVFGRAVHEVMAELMSNGTAPQFGDIWTPAYVQDEGELMYSKQEGDFETLLWKGQAIVTEMTNTLRVAGYEETVIDYDGKPVVEYQDYVQIKDGLSLSRTYDAMAIMDGVPTVIDFKTAYRMYTIGLQADVSEQLTGYLLPHSILGAPQPKQAMFIVGTKTKNPKGAYFSRQQHKGREIQFRKDLLKMDKIIKAKAYTRCRSDMNCGSEAAPRCEYRPMCYSGSVDIPVKDLYFYEGDDSK